jgi:hypothetical protein
VRGVAWSFWAALSALSILGLRYPLRMVPMLLLQMLYKTIWLLAVGLPLKFSATDLTKAMAVGLVFDLIAIPWSYVLVNYVKKPGDRWK